MEVDEEVSSYDFQAHQSLLPIDQSLDTSADDELQERLARYWENRAARDDSLPISDEGDNVSSGMANLSFEIVEEFFSPELATPSMPDKPFPRRRSRSIDLEPVKTAAGHATTSNNTNQYLDLAGAGATQVLQMQRRHASQENINRLAQPKTKSNEEGKQFVSLVQQVQKFHAATPDRFRTVKGAVPKIKQAFVPRLTQPKTPRLMTRTRVKPPPVVEEPIKYKFKAQPINKKVLQGPVVVPAHENENKKPATIPVPFNLTEVPKKRPPTPQKIKKEEKRPTHTKPIPFECEKRIERDLKEKQAKIDRYLEEERKAREFRANPVPKILQRKDDVGGANRRARSFDHVGHNQVQFKARPATVVHQRPFVPQKTSHVTQVEEFDLATNQRVLAWDEARQKKMEREQQEEELRRQQEERERRMEEEARKQLRKEMEVKAQKIRQYKPLEVQPSLKITEPEPFKWHSQTKNKENVPDNAGN